MRLFDYILYFTGLAEFYECRISSRHYVPPFYLKARRPRRLPHATLVQWSELFPSYAAADNFIFNLLASLISIHIH